MTKNNQVYKCNICGNIVEILHIGAGELVCCAQPMVLQQENTQDAALEKHVPVLEKTEKGILIKVGKVEHPMDKDHYIEWIEIIKKYGKIVRKNLLPGHKPEVRICCEDILKVRAYCNLHGLWTNNN